MFNRVIGLYLELKEWTKIKEEEFIQFFSLSIDNSIESGEKLLNERNLKRIHLVDE